VIDLLDPGRDGRDLAVFGFLQVPNLDLDHDSPFVDQLPGTPCGFEFLPRDHGSLSAAQLLGFPWCGSELLLREDERPF